MIFLVTAGRNSNIVHKDFVQLFKTSNKVQNILVSSIIVAKLTAVTEIDYL
jgi:hypothetical protein